MPICVYSLNAARNPVTEGNPLGLKSSVPALAKFFLMILFGRDPFIFHTIEVTTEEGTKRRDLEAYDNSLQPSTLGILAKVEETPVVLRIK